MTVVAETSSTITVDVVGDVGPTVALVAAHRPTSIEAGHPSLEETFLAHYGPTA